MKKNLLSSKPQTLILKQKQIDILLLLYKFYYLNRKHIQIMLKHKHFHRVIIWLNDLTNKQYVVRSFTRKFGAEAAVYCLGLEGRKELKKRDDVKIPLLSRVYREKRISEDFKKHMLLLADIYLLRLADTQKENKVLHFYTKTDLYGIEGLLLPLPDAYVATDYPDGTTKRFFLDIFDEKDPRGWYKKRVMQYLSYYDSEDWQIYHKKPFPLILFVCPNVTVEQYVRTFIKKKLEYEGVSLSFFTMTWEEIRTHTFPNKHVKISL